MYSRNCIAPDECQQYRDHRQVGKELCRRAAAESLPGIGKDDVRAIRVSGFGLGKICSTGLCPTLEEFPRGTGPLALTLLLSPRPLLPGRSQVYTQCRRSVWTAVGATIYPDTRARKFGSASASNLFSPCKARAIDLTSLSYMHVRETLPRYGTSTVNSSTATITSPPGGSVMISGHYSHGFQQGSDNTELLRRPLNYQVLVPNGRASRY